MASTTVRIDPKLAHLRIDKAEVQEACALLGIHKPVRIDALPTNVCGRRGDYRNAGAFHLIRLHARLDRAGASLTLWHELAHAMQVSDGGRLYADGARSGAYWQQPIEVEARAVAAEYGAAFPLTGIPA
jgi:hypothetical protein